MTYELTTLLTTIAASSASFVAILGGFIASKLISISGEREAVLTRISEVEQQRSYKQSELARLQKEENEDAAVDFISSNISSLIQHKDIESVYRNDLQYEVPVETLRPYWNRARVLVGELVNAVKSMGNGFELNENHLPRAFAEKYSNDDFAYTVSKKVMKYLIKQNRKKDPYGINIDWEDMVAANPIQSTMDRSRLETLQSEIAWLGLQRRQLLDEKERLSRPKGMKAGLIIFALFSVCCIIIPLALTPLAFASIKVYRTVKALILLVFSAGLVSIFGYLIHLLKWGEGKEK